ncbi:MAG: hypothetical protein J5J06_13535 [Phycisphaerae bacterium]|nr:hypothetical protein [Phycisphaerae bacterium]
MMTKTDAIDAITRLNATARPTFLAEFSLRELEEYLERLRSLRGDPELDARSSRDPVAPPPGSRRGDAALSHAETPGASRNPTTAPESAREDRLFA